MIIQKNKLQNEFLRKVKRGADIKYRIKLAGLTQKMIADELNVTESCISRVISGIATSQRVDNWLKENLGV